MLTSAAAQASAPVTTSFGGREVLVHVPPRLPPEGSRALVVVLHGGLGNAARIAGLQSESGMNLDAVADRDGFVVAYLNGTPVTRFMGPKMLGWNAGGCCGQPAQTGVDDVAYVKGAVDDLASKYGIDRKRVFGMGHSNGAMMTLRVICETDVFASAIAISGPLQIAATTCPPARGKSILAIHGADDQNVPLAGGKGTKGFAGVAFRSEAQSQQVFAASGATYALDVVSGADHMLDHIDAAMQKSEGVSVAEKSVRFFGLAKP
jgi:polyhydroxybutyrate depolymerase